MAKTPKAPLPSQPPRRSRGPIGSRGGALKPVQTANPVAEPIRQAKPPPPPRPPARVAPGDKGWVAPPAAPHPAPAPQPARGTQHPSGGHATNTTATPGAHALLNNFLAQFGLGQLADWAWKTYTSVGGGDVGMRLVQANLPNQQAFKTRFPAIAERTAKGLPAITPADYMNYETTLRQAFSAHGLPLPSQGAQFENMVRTLLVNDVSAAEVVNQRIGSAFDRVANAPIEVRQAAERMWGVNGDSALAAYFLDPNINAAELDRRSKSAEVAGTAMRFGIDINADRADRLTSLGADSNLGQFAAIAKLNPLFHANQGEDPNLTMANQGLGAAFGESATAAAEVERRLQQRKAAFAGGGGPYQQSSISSTPGSSGLGSGPT